MRRFETSIKELINAKNKYILSTGKNPIFLSDWDVDFNEITYPRLNLNITNEEAHKYYYWTDELNYKKHFKSFIKETYGVDISKNDFALSSNGTSSLFLAVMALKEKGIKNFLVFTPVYFTLLNLLDALDLNCYIYSLPLEPHKINFEEIKAIIKQNNIEGILITNPLFGTGIELSPPIINKFAELANQNNSWIVMDFVYGGMNWKTTNAKTYIFDYNYLKALSIAHNYILIESIAKRLFTNGAKFALLFSNEKMVRHILRLSIFSVGSMSALQAKMSKLVYEKESIDGVIAHIQNNIDTAQNNYRILQSITLGTQIELTHTNCGYFTLASIPCENTSDDMQYAVKLLTNYGIMTTPHSRYLFNKTGYYSFRINLLLNKRDLYEGVSLVKKILKK